MVMRVLVTGANGFIGKHLCKHLLNQSDIEIYAAVRSPYARVDAHETIVVGELEAFDDWRNALSGVDAVVHLAGRVHQTDADAAKDEHAFKRANVDATRVLLDACKAHGVKRFIHMSTIAVLGNDSEDEPFTTEAEPAPFNPYSDSKARAEQYVLASGLNSTIIRIPLTYGAGVKANFLALMKHIKQRQPLPVRFAANQRSVLYVGNLCAAIGHLLHHSCPQPIVHISDEPALSTRTLCVQISDALEVKPRILPVPLWSMRVAARVTKKQDLYQKLFGNLAMDTTESYRAMGWEPPHSTESGLRETARWFKRNTL